MIAMDIYLLGLLLGQANQNRDDVVRLGRISVFCLSRQLLGRREKLSRFPGF